MRIVIAALGAAALGACAQEPPPASNVGRYQIIETSQGVFRIDTVNGETKLAVSGPPPQFGAYVVRPNGQALVWTDVKPSN